MEIVGRRSRWRMRFKNVEEEQLVVGEAGKGKSRNAGEDEEGEESRE